ncbi:MAG: helix-turn-helix domain-containing protein [Lachnospiraceae bacterium]
MEIDFKVIGKRIKNARIQADLTQEKLAELIGVSIPYMSNIERGTTKVSLTRLISIANALSTDGIDQFVYDLVKQHRVNYHKEIQSILEDCDGSEISFIVQKLKDIKIDMHELKKLYENEKDKETD